MSEQFDYDYWYTSYGDDAHLLGEVFNIATTINMNYPGVIGELNQYLEDDDYSPYRLYELLDSLHQQCEMGLIAGATVALDDGEQVMAISTSRSRLGDNDTESIAALESRASRITHALRVINQSLKLSAFRWMAGFKYY